MFNNRGRADDGQAETGLAVTYMGRTDLILYSLRCTPLPSCSIDHYV